VRRAGARGGRLIGSYIQLLECARFLRPNPITQTEGADGKHERNRFGTTALSFNSTTRLAHVMTQKDESA
jgi:hypothetical protein